MPNKQGTITVTDDDLAPASPIGGQPTPEEPTTPFINFLQHAAPPEKSGPPGSADFLNRELNAFGDTLLGAPESVASSFSQSPTPEERKEFRLPEQPGFLNKMGLGLARNVGLPFQNAAEWYKREYELHKKGQQPASATLDKLLESAPEGLGSAGATTILGKVGEEAPGRIGKVPAATRIISQEMMGAGKEPVLQARIAYEQALKDFREATAEKKSEYASKVADARREWVSKAMEAKRGQAEAAANKSKRETLRRGQESYTERLQKNIKQTFDTTKARLDARWMKLRSTPIKRGASLTILKDEPLNSKAIADTVDFAEKKYLQGAPESIKQFRDLMNWMREDTGGASASMVDEAGGEKPALRPITWDEARTHYSALGDRMFSGDLPSNVFRAIDHVRNGMDSEGKPLPGTLGGQLKAGAGRAGVLPEYESVMRDWSSFESDWKDMSSVTRGGGSPLAVALKAPSPETLMPQVTGRTGNLLIERLAKYRDQGGSPTTAAAIRRLQREIDAVPKTKAPASPDALKLPPEPKLGKPPKVPDPVAIRRNNLISAAGRKVGWMDLIPPYLVEHMAVKSPAIREWIARQPREETKVP
jgi:hypothetical protein